MSFYFEQELDRLQKALRSMARHAEESVEQAMQALLERNDALARQVIDGDSVLDRLEIAIDDLSIHLLAKAPLATDLRLITVAMKISHDLERVGDEATTIARRAIELTSEPELKLNVDIPRMAALALDMLKDAIESYTNRHVAKARALIPRDNEVDALNKQTYRLLVSYIIENPAYTTRCLHFMMVAKSLERIADHATNIAEEVVFLYEAQDIRHSLGVKEPSNQPDGR